MTFEEMLAMQAQKKGNRRKPGNLEHRLQTDMIRWYRLRYPQMAHNLFAVPNGAKRDAVTAAKLKEEGVLAGVADLILLKSNRFYGALLIEVKTPTGRQSDAQKQWQSLITPDGYKYVVVRSLDDFIREVNQYLSED